MSDAERIRTFVFEKRIKPARACGKTTVRVTAREINDVLNLKNHFKNITQSLTGQKFRDLASVPTPKVFGTQESSTAVFMFKI